MGSPARFGPISSQRDAQPTLAHRSTHPERRLSIVAVGQQGPMTLHRPAAVATEPLHGTQASYPVAGLRSTAWGQVIYGGVIAVLAVGLGVLKDRTSVLDPRTLGIVLLLVVGWTTWNVLRVPHRVDTDHDGLRFVARRRLVTARWDEVESVRPSLWSRTRSTLVWTLRDGRKVRTPRNLAGIEDLGVELRRRSPTAIVDL
jgi:hypothetical protein